MIHNTSSSRRTKWLFTAALLATAVTLAGCLTFPLGDPETSKIDPAITGIWLTKAPDGDASELLAVLPYDPRTYLVQDLKYTKTTTGYAPRGQVHLKAWLTPIAGQTFVTAQVLDPKSLLEPGDPTYIILKLTHTGDDLTLQPLSDKFIQDNKVATPADLAKLIAANIQNPALYESTASAYHRATPDQKEELKSALDAFVDHVSGTVQSSAQETPTGL